MDEKLKLVLIYGSVREGRFCDTVAEWVIEQIRAKERYELNVVDPKRHEPTPGSHEEDARLEKHLDEADAFIVVTPEYNHSYPAALKELIDSFHAEWQAKPVAFVSYGGVSGGLRAVEHLRTVFAELHAVGIRDSVSFPNAWEQFNAQGRLLAPERAERGMATLLARLTWWAQALRVARAKSSYAKAVA